MRKCTQIKYPKNQIYSNVISGMIGGWTFRWINDRNIQIFSLKLPIDILQACVGSSIFRTQESLTFGMWARESVSSLLAALLMKSSKSESSPALLIADTVSDLLNLLLYSLRLELKNSNFMCLYACLEENLALYERKSLRQICEKMAGKTLTSRSNVLLVRQSRLTPGNGVLLSFQSKKNMKKSHHEGQSKNYFDKCTTVIFEAQT